MNFNDIYELCYPSVYRLCFRITGCKEESLDIVQETFIKYHECAGSDIKNPRAWLLRVASNLSVNVYNKRKRRREQGIMPDEPVYPLPEEEVLEKEEIFLVRKTLNDLKKKEKIILMLHQDDLSHEEMAMVLKIKKSSVGKTLSRAQKRFALKWEVNKNGCAG